MSYEYIFSKKAKKDIDKLDPIVKKRIARKLQVFQKAPLSFAKKLINSRIGEYRFRVGDYRITFDLDSKTQKILVLRVDHRRQVYK